MTHDGIMGNVPEQRAGSLPEQARARHASVPRGRLGNGEEGKKKRARHVSLASPLRIETPEVGAKLSEGEALIGSGNCEHEKKAIGRVLPHSLSHRIPQVSYTFLSINPIWLEDIVRN